MCEYYKVRISGPRFCVTYKCEVENDDSGDDELATAVSGAIRMISDHAVCLVDVLGQVVCMLDEPKVEMEDKNTAYGRLQIARGRLWRSAHSLYLAGGEHKRAVATWGRGIESAT